MNHRDLQSKLLAGVMALLVIFFSVGILMNGSSFAAVDGRFARELGLSGSAAIPYVPWIALAAYLFAVVPIRRIKTRWKRWVSFILATLVANLVVFYPVGLLRQGSVRIPIVEHLSAESHAAFEKRYSVRWVEYSSSTEGTCVRVRREDYSRALAEFVVGLAEHQRNSRTPLDLRGTFAFEHAGLCVDGVES